MTQSNPIAALIAHERLPASFAAETLPIYRRVAETVIARRAALGRPMVLGVSGPQGSGKSTLAAFLEALLQEAGLRVALLSLDDLYLTRAERLRLAAAVHPLLATRGVPGTHDVELGLRVIERLLTAGPEDSVALPRFDKSVDDRAPQDRWPVFRGQADVVLFEGWCVGATPQDAAALARPINELERERDPNGLWRAYVNAALEGPYRRLFGLIDLLVAVRAPSFDCVQAWRSEQERKLALSLGIDPDRRAPGREGLKVMSDAEIASFIQHYERLTRALIEELPGRADILIQLEGSRRIAGLTGPALTSCVG
jgi:D-glycerate 3-kinase